MKNSGKGNILLVIGLLGIAAVGALVFFGKEAPSTVASRFMQALEKGDVETLTRLSYLGSDTPETMRKKWDYTINVVAPNYHFGWKVVSEKSSGKQTASVKLLVVRNVGTGSEYDEKFDLPMVLDNGQWKVEVKGISRDMFPGLPR